MEKESTVNNQFDKKLTPERASAMILNIIEQLEKDQNCNVTTACLIRCSRPMHADDTIVTYTRSVYIDASRLQRSYEQGAVE